MIKFFANISTRYPWLVILFTLGLTAFMLYQIKTNLRIEPDMTKFMPNSMPTTKANDYYNKNYNFQNSLLIGIEATEGHLMTPEKLRVIESVVERISKLKLEKNFNSTLTGKNEKISFGLNLDIENISSLPGIEDALLDSETGSVVSGSLVKKFKDDLNIEYAAGEEDLLPKKDEDLLRLIPHLEKRILSDSLFAGNVLSLDKKASSIRIPMVRKWDYKRRYAIQEIKVGLDEDRLKNRYQGKDDNFPYEIYNKTIGLTTYNDSFIQQHSSQLAQEIQGLLTSQLEPLFLDYPQLAELLNEPVNVERFEAILKIMDQRAFYLHPEMLTWENATNGLWEFTLKVIDPASREALEFQLYDVLDINDLALVYNTINQTLQEYEGNGMRFHVAGSPVVMAVFSEMIGKDMGLLLPIGIVVIFIILALSFRSVRGVIIPLMTVILSMIWALGSMAISDVPVTAMSSILPIVLLAVGSAYGIHLLNRYFKDISKFEDKRESIRFTISEVGAAIVMAGLTTFAGFLSLMSSELSMIQDFGLFSALGVVYALFLTLTFSPALLSYWNLPRKIKQASTTEKPLNPDIIDQLFSWYVEKVITYHKLVVGFFIIVLLAAMAVVPQLELEGGQMDNFKDGNLIKESDRFLTSKLTGTGQFNLLFEFREEADLTGSKAQTELQQKTQNLKTAYANFVKELAIEETAPQFNLNSENPKKLAQELNLMQDILNEEYAVEILETEDSSLAELDSSSDLDDLESDDLSALESNETLESDDLDELGDEDNVAENSGDFAELSPEQIAGLQEITQRLGFNTEDWQSTSGLILSLRAETESTQKQELLLSINEAKDLYAVNVKQPKVMHKLVELKNKMLALQTPIAKFSDGDLPPTGFVTTPADLVSRFYKVFYHDDDPQYNRLPNVKTDGLADATLTDRSVIGVVLNQAQSGSRDTFDAMISPDLREFQVTILARKETSSFTVAYQDQLDQIVAELFPANDAYIKKVTLTGFAPKSTELTMLISTSQMKSIVTAFILVFIVTFFIFRSVTGGLLSILPLFITVLGNFGTMWLLGWKINTGTMLVASISIGIGVDYTIHFLERYKIQLSRGDDLYDAYRHTVHAVGKAVLINATSVALGFLVLVLSDFVGNMAMGILMAGTMIYSSAGALIFLPALIFWMKPKIFTDRIQSTSNHAQAA